MSQAKNTVNFIGKIDGVIRLTDQLYVFEHKTTGSSVDTVIKSLYRSAQTIGYTYALRHLYPDESIAGCYVNLLQTPAKRKKKDGTFSDVEFSVKNYHRDPQIYTKKDTDDWLSSMLNRVGQIAKCRITGVWPMEFDNCYPFGRTCQYTELCMQHCDAKDVQTDGFIEDHWDPRSE